MRKKVIVLGANFGGLTAALSVKHDLHGDVDVTVVSDRDYFLFNPSLIWLPFGKRNSSDVTFRVEPTFDKGDVDFELSAAKGIDPVSQTVTLENGKVLTYDYLVIATGTRNRGEAIEGFAENSHTITTLESAIKTGEAWKRYLDSPGDIVIGASQGASCFGAAYEFLFNTSYQLKKAGLRGKVNLTYLTSEPFLGHFGIGGMPHGEAIVGKFFKNQGITFHVNKSISTIDDGAITTTDGDVLKNSFSMIVPPFSGQSFLKELAGLADQNGFVKVKDSYQTELWDNIYAVGLAAAVTAPWKTPTPIGVPKTGFPTEQMAHVAAKNIVHQIKGELPSVTKAFADIPAVCILDAGNNGVLILAEKMFPPRKHGMLIPGPQNHLFKLAFEKYFLWKMRNGKITLP